MDFVYPPNILILAMLPSAYFILAWIHMRNGKVNDLVVVEVSARGELPTIAPLPRIIPSQFGAIN